MDEPYPLASFNICICTRLMKTGLMSKSSRDWVLPLRLGTHDWNPVSYCYILWPANDLLLNFEATQISFIPILLVAK